MAAYSIYEAKAKLSSVLKEVKNGHDAIITERGRPIARVIPYKINETFEERIERLIAKGVILPAREKGPIPKSSIHRPGALQRFLADRE